MSDSLKLQCIAFATFSSFIFLNFRVLVLKKAARLVLLELELQLSSPSTPNISKVAYAHA